MRIADFMKIQNCFILLPHIPFFSIFFLRDFLLIINHLSQKNITFISHFLPIIFPQCLNPSAPPAILRDLVPGDYHYFLTISHLPQFCGSCSGKPNRNFSTYFRHFAGLREKLRFLNCR
jgi:hypothetical protein